MPVHEYGMVQSLLATVDENVHRHGGARAVQVVVSVGLLDGAHEGELRAAFDQYKSTSTARGAELVVERAPEDVACLDCGGSTPGFAGPDLRCPDCGGERLRSLAGPELWLKSVVMEA